MDRPGRRPTVGTEDLAGLPLFSRAIHQVLRGIDSPGGPWLSYSCSVTSRNEQMLQRVYCVCDP